MHPLLSKPGWSRHMHCMDVMSCIFSDCAHQREAVDLRTVVNYRQTFWCCFKNNKSKESRTEDGKRQKCDDADLKLIIPIAGNSK